VIRFLKKLFKTPKIEKKRGPDPKSPAPVKVYFPSELTEQIDFPVPVELRKLMENLAESGEITIEIIYNRENPYQPKFKIWFLREEFTREAAGLGAGPTLEIALADAIEDFINELTLKIKNPEKKLK
jgi:hypothetical protein